MQLLRQRMRTICKRKGKTLVVEGDELNAVFYVLAGELTVSARSESGTVCHVTCKMEMTSSSRDWDLIRSWERKR